MTRLFLGKWWHWGILIGIVALLWYAGQRKMHVIHFNLFVSLLVIGTVVCVVMIVRGNRPGDSVTRDPIIDDD